ncbi:MerR family transcriptional regulator [Sphaerisporangium sp. NPDC005288]|uniref:MerR family transcriptional regulator n=1 Tax=Sphaerisporangium sp. NPDC005288 TaxID=3155114 RepID=UPI0033BB620B
MGHDGAARDGDGAAQDGDGAAQDGGGPPAGDEPGYGIGAVARRLGVPVPTLRTWNLRYGIGPSRRSPGGHRRYDEADLRRLEEMNRLIHAGVAPADAAGHALRHRPPPGPVAPAAATAGSVPSPERTPAGESGHAAAGEPGTAGSVPGRTAIGEPGHARGEEARSPATPGRPPSAAALARAALALDVRTVDGRLEAALHDRGVAWTWERLVRPAFAVIVGRQEETGAGVEVEHMFSERLLDALAARAREAPDPAYPRPVLLACAEEEQHSLPVYALAAALGELAVETRVLGPRTPYAALEAAMRRLGPSVVFVWSHRRETGDAVPLAALPRLRPASRVVVGGPGWADVLPPGTARVSTLPEAITAVMGLLR